MKLDLDSISKLRLPPNWRNLLLDLPNQPGFSKIPIILTGLMILLLTSSLAKFTWMLFSVDSDITNSRSSQPFVLKRNINIQSVRLRDVASLSLFGKAEEKNIIATEKELIDAPDTRLQLTLKGLLALDDPTRAIAIIADNNGKEKHYLAGATLPGNAKLHTIYADRVILSRAGRLETLRLPKTKLSEGAVVRKTVQTKSRQVKGGNGLKAMRENLIKNPQDVWKNIRIEPKMSKSGGIQGYTLSHKDKQLMRSLGIRKSDVITSVNGMPLNDPTSLYQILDILKTTQQLNLSIIRNGTEQTLSIDMM
ncbi:MAG: type II secretion system protein GspC [Thiohalomonadales bacterium]